MIKTNTRIQTSIGKATVWPISEYFYSVVYDDGLNAITVSKQLAERYFEEGAWQMISDQLPKTFKFKVKNSVAAFDHVYTYIESEGTRNNIFWNDNTESTYYYKEQVEIYLKNGEWIILNEVPFDAYTANLHNNEETIFSKAVEYTKGDKVASFDNQTIELKLNLESMDRLDESIEQLQDHSLQRIKSFTSDGAHDVWITEGVYKVFRQYEDIPYIARDENALIEIINAIEVLDSAETE